MRLAGGHAALHYSLSFPGCTVLLANPRLNIAERPWSRSVAQYVEVCHGLEAPWRPTGEDLQFLLDEEFGPYDVGTLIEPRADRLILYYQNLGDTNFLKYQALPYFERHANNSNLLVRLSPDSVGHAVIPKSTIREIISALTVEKGPADQARDAGFKEVFDALYSATFNYPEQMAAYARVSDELESQRSAAEQLKNENSTFLAAYDSFSTQVSASRSDLVI